MKPNVRRPLHATLPQTGRPSAPDLLGRTVNVLRPFLSSVPASNDRPDETSFDVEEIKRRAEQQGLLAAKGKVEALAHRYLDAIARLTAAVHEGSRPDAHQIVELAMIVGRAVVAHELSARHELLLATVESALLAVRDDEAVHVRLGPTDLAYVQQNRPELAQSGVRFVEDATLAIGGCIVESTQRVIDASIEARLASVRAAVTAIFSEVGPDAISGDGAAGDDVEYVENVESIGSIESVESVESREEEDAC